MVPKSWDQQLCILSFCIPLLSAKNMAVDNHHPFKLHRYFSCKTNGCGSRVKTCGPTRYHRFQSSLVLTIQFLGVAIFDPQFFVNRCSSTAPGPPGPPDTSAARPSLVTGAPVSWQSRAGTPLPTGFMAVSYP